jgi:hypothetical protein
MQKLRVGGVASVLLVVGCLAGKGRGYALYATTSTPLKPEEVAQLTGYVQKVDGKDVGEHGRSFELLPGCHVVVTPQDWGKVSEVGGITWKTGHLTFALPMKAGRQYLVEVQAEKVGGAAAGGRVVALEKDMDGNLTQEFRPASGAQDLAACREADNPAQP